MTVGVKRAQLVSQNTSISDRLHFEWFVQQQSNTPREEAHAEDWRTPTTLGRPCSWLWNAFQISRGDAQAAVGGRERGPSPFVPLLRDKEDAAVSLCHLGALGQLKPSTSKRDGIPRLLDAATQGQPMMWGLSHQDCPGRARWASSVPWSCLWGMMEQQQQTKSWATLYSWQKSVNKCSEQRLCSFRFRFAKPFVRKEVRNHNSFFFYRIYLVQIVFSVTLSKIIIYLCLSFLYLKNKSHMDNCVTT